MQLPYSLSYSRITYIDDGVNPPSFINHPLATTHIEDRGYQFADGIYEVVAINNKKFIDFKLHYLRLKRSLDALEINFNLTQKTILSLTNELIRLNNAKDCILYLQVTRGIAKRNHSFPSGIRPSVVMTLSPWAKPKNNELEDGVKVITHEDIRWGRKDIKSISLLPNILAKQQAVKQKAKEAWLYTKDNIVTEGSSSNTYIIDQNNTIITHPANYNILGGVTRDVVLNLAKKNKIKVKETPFNLSQLKSAKEAFMTSTTIV